MVVKEKVVGVEDGELENEQAARRDARRRGTDAIKVGVYQVSYTPRPSWAPLFSFAASLPQDFCTVTISATKLSFDVQTFVNVENYKDGICLRGYHFCE